MTYLINESTMLIKKHLYIITGLGKISVRNQCGKMAAGRKAKISLVIGFPNEVP